VTLSERLLVLHRALEKAGVPHAFGGAIALAYCTLHARGTIDIDVNVFVPASDPKAALAALPDAIAQPDGLPEEIARDGQARLWWDEMPVDLFFDYAPIHAQAAAHARGVPFDGAEILVLGPIELVVFKVMFDRAQDWVDVDAVLEAGTVDPEAVHAALEELLEPDDPRFERLADAARRAGFGAG
jgi:hypothetical protein